MLDIRAKMLARMKPLAENSASSGPSSSSSVMSLLLPILSTKVRAFLKDLSIQPDGTNGAKFYHLVDSPSSSTQHHQEEQQKLASSPSPSCSLDRESFFGGFSSTSIISKPTPLINRVRSIFARVSKENYDEISQELRNLPILEKIDDADDEVRSILHFIYDKAVQPEDAAFIDLYVDLIRDLALDIEAKNSAKAAVVRNALVEKCRETFENRAVVCGGAAAGAASSDFASDNNVSNKKEHQQQQQLASSSAETTTRSGVDTTASAALKKAIAADDDSVQYVIEREKQRLEGSIKLVAQLFRVNIVSAAGVEAVLSSLLFGVDDGSAIKQQQQQQQQEQQQHTAEDYELVLAVKLIKEVQPHLPQQDSFLPKYLNELKSYTTTTTTSSSSDGKNLQFRTKCLIMDLIELSENNWVARNSRKKNTSSKPAGFDLGLDNARTQHHHHSSNNNNNGSSSTTYRQPPNSNGSTCSGGVGGGGAGAINSPHFVGTSSSSLSLSSSSQPPTDPTPTCPLFPRRDCVLLPPSGSLASIASDAAVISNTPRSCHQQQQQQSSYPRPRTPMSRTMVRHPTTPATCVNNISNGMMMMTPNNKSVVVVVGHSEKKEEEKGAAAASPPPPLPTKTIFEILDEFKASQPSDDQILLGHFSRLSDENNIPFCLDDDDDDADDDCDDDNDDDDENEYEDNKKAGARVVISQRTQQLVQWFSKSVTLARLSEDRKLAARVVKILIEHRLVAHNTGSKVMALVAAKTVVPEHEDNPKIFSSWNEFVVASSPASSSPLGDDLVIPASVHTALLRELLKKDEVAFESVEKMILETSTHSIKKVLPLSSASPASSLFPTEAALTRFRSLPRVLSCDRQYGDDDDAGYLYDRDDDDDDDMPLVASAFPKKDLLGFLTTSSSSSSSSSAKDSVMTELSVFQTLTADAPDAVMSDNIDAVLELAKTHMSSSSAAAAGGAPHPPSSTAITTTAGFFCAIFCYLRFAVAVNDDTDIDAFREVLAVLGVPGENTQLFLRECYMTHCDLLAGGGAAGSPPRAFDAMVMKFILASSSSCGATTTDADNRRRISDELKQFADWRNRMAGDILLATSASSQQPLSPTTTATTALGVQQPSLPIINNNSNLHSLLTELGLIFAPYPTQAQVGTHFTASRSAPAQRDLLALLFVGGLHPRCTVAQVRAMITIFCGGVVAQDVRMVKKKDGKASGAAIVEVLRGDENKVIVGLHKCVLLDEDGYHKARTTEEVELMEMYSDLLQRDDDIRFQMRPFKSVTVTLGDAPGTPPHLRHQHEGKYHPLCPSCRSFREQFTDDSYLLSTYLPQLAPAALAAPAGHRIAVHSTPPIPGAPSDGERFVMLRPLMLKRCNEGVRAAWKYRVRRSYSCKSHPSGAAAAASSGGGSVQQRQQQQQQQQSQPAAVVTALPSTLMTGAPSFPPRGAPMAPFFSNRKR